MERIVITEDANKWLLTQKNIKCIVTSLPDMEEINCCYDEWLSFIKTSCQNMINSLDESGVIFFYQTDRKHKGSIIDKKRIISSVFIEHGYKLILSKIVLKQEPNTINLFRPTFTNLFAFSKKLTPGSATPDVIYTGKMLYKNAMGYNAICVCVAYCVKNNIKQVVDPFCGMGSVLKVFNDYGFSSIGVDIDENQTKIASEL